MKKLNEKEKENEKDKEEDNQNNEDEDEGSGNKLVTFAVTCVYKPFEAYEDEAEEDLQIRDNAAEEGTNGAASTDNTNAANTTDTANSVEEGTGNEQ